jgi:hypothetical protein
VLSWENANSDIEIRAAVKKSFIVQISDYGFSKEIHNITQAEE